MARYSYFSICSLTVLLAVFQCLLPAACFPESLSREPVFLPGDVLLAQAESTGPESPLPDDERPAGPQIAGKSGSRVLARIYAGVNYRIDALDWNIAGNKNGTHPNILSELTWEDLNIYELSLGFSSLVKHTVYFKAYMNYGRIFSGENQDSDYDSDNRQDEWSRSNNSADDGSTIDVSLGAGVVLPIVRDTFTLMPMVGFSYHRQDLAMTDGYQTIPPAGPFPDLDSTYEAEWRGPWVGLDLHLETDTGWKALQGVYLFAGFEYHWAIYDAKADWNLRDDFEHPVSFEHEADGSGVRIAAGLGASLTERWSLEVGCSQQEWLAEDGTDRVFFSDGTYGETRLNEVNWESRAVGLMIRYQF